MIIAKPIRALIDDKVVFFQEFLKHPRQIASIIPSSRYLERRVIKTARINSARTIIELGSGTGGITRAVLREMARDARLLSIEINPQLHDLVSHIDDKRFIAHLGDAQELKEIISMHELEAPEVVISGIPFSTMSPVSGAKILETILSVLLPGGRFVAYQVSNRVASLGRPLLGPGQQDLELFNIPPLRVYRWEKTAVNTPG